MVKYITITLILIYSLSAQSQAEYDDCVTAFKIDNPSNFCGRFVTENALASRYEVPDCWPEGDNNDIWLSFRAIGTSVNIVFTQATSPRIELYRGDCSRTLFQASCISSTGSQAKLLRHDIIPGSIYLIRIATNPTDNSDFRICVDNYNPPVMAGQDCNIGAILCDKSPFVIQDLVGPGSEGDEAAGSCLAPFGSVSESNSSWLKWTCDLDGTLEFTITPLNTLDDIDFALYSLGNDINNCDNKTLLRCVAASCDGPTGIREREDNDHEEAGCFNGQNGFVREILMEEGESYALIINNFTNTGAGVRIEFFGSGTFRGPKPDFIIEPLAGLKCDQTFSVRDSTIISAGTSITNYKWNFGEEAILMTEEDPDLGPFDIDYFSFGDKAVALTVTSDMGCVVTNIIELDVEPCCEDLPPVELVLLEQKDPTCIGFTDGQIMVEASMGQGEYQYSLNGSIFDFFDDYKDLEAGDYSLDVIDAKGCEGSLDFSLVDPPEIEVDAGDDQEIELGDSTMLDGMFFTTDGSDFSIEWSPSENIPNYNQLNPYVTPPGETIYTLTVANEEGCAFFDEVIIRTINVKGLFVPNVIKYQSGENGLFTIKAKRSTKSIVLLNIYDRFGNLVHKVENVSPDDPALAWDGTFNGQVLNSGVYSWLIQVVYFDDEAEYFSGTVTLVR